MLQAASLASLDEAEAATKSIYYAQLARSEERRVGKECRL